MHVGENLSLRLLGQNYTLSSSHPRIYVRVNPRQAVVAVRGDLNERENCS